MQIHLKDIRLKLCEGSFHEDNNKENIQYIPLVNAEVKIWNRDKTKVLYHNTASDNGVLEFSNCEIEDDEFTLYLEIKHQDFEKTPIGGNLYVRKGMENQENRIYFKRIKLRLKHAPFARLQTPKEFYQALNPSKEERKKYAEGDKEKENDWDTLMKRAEEMLARNEAILQKYENEGTKDQFESKRKRHKKQKANLEEMKKEGGEKDIQKLKDFINTRVGADYAEWVTALCLARHAPYLCNQRISAEEIMELEKKSGDETNGEIKGLQDNKGQKGSDPDFLIELGNGKKMLIEVKNYGYSNSLELTDQIAYQLKFVKINEMNYAIACNRSTRIGNRTTKQESSPENTNYNFVFDPNNKDNKAKSENDKDLQDLEKAFKRRGQGLRKILIKMYKDALNGNPSWVFVKRLNFRSNLESLDNKQSSNEDSNSNKPFDLEKHFLNLYSNLHSQDRQAFQCEFEVILEN